MHWSKRQILVLRLLGVSAAAGFVGQLLWHRALRAEIETLRTANRTLPPLRRENFALRKSAAELARLQKDEAELARLRFEALALQTKLEAAALLPPFRPMAIPKPTMPRSEGRFVIGSGGSPGTKSQTVPVYPSNLRAAGIGDVVDVALTVDREGNITDSWVVNSTRPEFESSALEAIKSWKYRPAPPGEGSAEVTMVVPITFDSQKGRVSIGRSQPVPLPAARPAPSPAPDWF